MSQLERLLHAATQVASRHTELHRRAEEFAGAPTIRGESQPRDRQLWCDLHERTVDRCHRFDYACKGVPLPDVSDPVGDAVTSGAPHHVQSAVWLGDHERDLLQALRMWLKDATDVLRHDPGGAADWAGYGLCLIDGCGRVMPGVGNERIRSGLCSACYRAWCRARERDPSVELATWRIHREKWLTRHTPDEIEEDDE